MGLRTIDQVIKRDMIHPQLTELNDRSAASFHDALDEGSLTLSIDSSLANTLIADSREVHCSISFTPHHY